MRERSLSVLILILACSIFTFGCSHTLEVKNLSDFIPAGPSISGKEIALGIKPLIGTAKDIWYFNAVVEKLNQRRDIIKMQTNYMGRGDFNPDYTVSINPKVKYESSSRNFLISFPGFLIFTPAWNGYVYFCNITTNVTIYDSALKELKTLRVETPYSIRHADFNRTWIDTGLGWFSYGISSLAAGVYYANNYDSNINNNLQMAIKDNYSTYISERIMQELASAKQFNPQTEVLTGPPVKSDSVTKTGVDILKYKRVAVLDFASASASSNSGKEIADIISAKLMKRGLSIVERSKLNKIMEEYSLSMSGVTDSNGIAKLGKITGASAIVMGNVTAYECRGERCRVSLTAKMIDVETGEVVWSGSGSGQGEESPQSYASAILEKITNFR